MTAKQEQLYAKGQTDDELVKKYQKHLKESDEIILVFPLWFNNVPAILKGFFDKVFLKEFAVITGLKLSLYRSIISYCALF